MLDRPGGHLRVLKNLWMAVLARKKAVNLSHLFGLNYLISIA